MEANKITFFGRILVVPKFQKYCSAFNLFSELGIFFFQLQQGIMKNRVVRVCTRMALFKSQGDPVSSSYFFPFNDPCTTWNEGVALELPAFCTNTQG